MTNSSLPPSPEETPSKGSSSGRWYFQLKSPRQALEPERVPPRPASHKARHPLVVGLSALFSIAVFLILASLVALFWGGRDFQSQGPLKAEKTVMIPRGQGVTDIANILAREGVISHPTVFVGAAHFRRLTSELKAGEYAFKPEVSAREVMDVLAEGKAVLHSVTLPEGLTSEQIVQRLRENDVLTGEVSVLPKEGTLLPETYKFSRGTTRQQLIQRMSQEQTRVLNEVWARRTPNLPIKTPQDLVILASIVEKETGRADERTRVASVFHNRLSQRMRLQSDPTIVYGLVGGKGSLGRPISRADIDSKTPFNTYVIDGLPPAPIANPGRASLEAVANPSLTKDLYFVAAGDGTHTFSETYEAHQRAVARLREWERRQDDAKPAASTEATDVPTYSRSGVSSHGSPPATSAVGAGQPDAVLDPLQQKGYDLQSPKTVPNLR